MKITLIGGGSSTFTPQLLQLFIASPALRGATISLMDIDEHRLEVMTTLSRLLIEKTGADLRVEGTTDRRSALAGAAFVITAISVGGFDAWEKDIEIPATYGIYMPIADSIGPGGIMRAFRHIPVLAEVARDVAELAPDAWVFNYTNPLTANCIAMRRAAPAVNTVGLCTCSSIPRVPLHLAWFANIEPEELVLPAPAGGLNHCAAILSLRLRDGRDAFPLLRERVVEPVTRWVLETYNILPYCWSHWTEFYLPLSRLEEPYQGRLQGLRMQYGITVHDMAHERDRARHWEDVATRFAEGAEGLSLDVLPRDESVQVVQIMEALLAGTNEVHVVNVPNRGAIPNLPAEGGRRGLFAGWRLWHPAPAGRSAARACSRRAAPACHSAGADSRGGTDGGPAACPAGLPAGPADRSDAHASGDGQASRRDAEGTRTVSAPVCIAEPTLSARPRPTAAAEAGHLRPSSGLLPLSGRMKERPRGAVAGSRADRLVRS